LICPIIAADLNFATVYGIHIKEGVFFSGNYVPGQVILNESAVRALGWKSATGQSFGEVAGVPLTVAGVVKDFNISSLHDQLQPLVIMNVRDLKYYNYLSVKLGTNNIHQTITAIQAKWKELYPGIPFEYFFMNDKFQSLYKSDLQLQRASLIATILNLLIVFFGVVGIVSFTILKRTKEIAVRKILGADTKKILLLFVKEYSISILIANIIGWPLAYFITTKWLQSYAYRVEQTIFPFISVSIIMFFVIILIIVIQCYKAAVSNPVNSLRTE
ncbi:MAG TPA: FtsX-like permease family protein, partial [Bacteroidia bacterium]|nr:FtsX-like permease family protein [Bacteroidia bacterium]